ncbi:NAD(P)-dependent alcohol dehydrogenase [Paracnuella aquatica]|uniref:NAD(P)-dependent alcohol dehydrogenase n=1 Tax=Paracnuella aquatica TaxID=2268757 RepID=UPI000DEEEDA9|nr:NAD(P)-dependent alcohol dehydrogenase [Paracnuella aquatica]RPD48260.1 NAD(P)-dependent alcohol dehydrogenase [Paracnuella aquatica]
MPQVQTSAASTAIGTIPSKGYAAGAASAQLAPWNFERRAPGPHDVQIDIRYCGICHTDLHFLRNDWGISVYPMVPGHEIVGVVTHVGDHVHKFKEGDLVGVGCMVESCRVCDSCNNGEQQYCHNGMTLTYNGAEKGTGNITYGGYSNNIVVNEDFVLRVSEKLPLEAVAPLLCAGITTYSPMRRFKIGKGDKVAVLGLGGLGHMAVKFAASFGADVTVLSSSSHKEADAKRLGAHNFVVTTNEEQVKKVAKKFDYIIDTVSSKHNDNFYLEMLKSKGTLICLGVPAEPRELHWYPLQFQGRVVVGSIIGGIAETQEMLDYCAANNITADIELIAMRDIHQAYDRMEKSDVKYRFVIDMATL